MAEVKFSDIAEFLGVDVKTIDSVDKFKETFEKDFLRVSTLTGKEDVLKPFVGKSISSLETKLKQEAKKYNAEWSGKEWDDKPINEKLGFVLGKITSDGNAAIEEAKKSAGTGVDEKVKEWESKYGKLESKHKDVESLLNSTKTDFETFKTQKETEFKGIKLNTIKEEAIKKIKFKSGISDIEKRGFMSLLSEKYNIDLDEKGEAFVSDKEGNRIKSAKVTGTFKNLDDVFSEEAIASKVIEMNPHANGKPLAPAVNGNGTPAAPNIFGGPQNRPVHPSALL